MNNEIKPTYLTYEQSKLFISKGCNIKKDSRFFFNSEEITKTLSKSIHPIIYAFEQWEIIEWLRVKYNIDLQAVCNYSKLGRTYRMGIIFVNDDKKVDSIFLRPENEKFEFIEFNTPQEAYSAAFDYILENLI